MPTIKQLRLESGLSAKAFAEKMGISHDLQRSYECERVPIPEKRLVKAEAIVKKVKRI